MLMCCTFISCSKRNYATNTAYQFKSTTDTPDYSNLNYWAAHPWKWDPSDSIPSPLRNNYKKDSVADVFFLYPTSLISFTDTRLNATFEDNVLNAKTDYSSILYQASAFAEQTRVFAPRYRQAHLRSYYTMDTAQASKAFDIAYQDVKESFIYYLKHYNNGKPIIIASHSQGTTHAIRLIKEFFDSTVLKEKLICAYLIGMPVPEGQFTNIFPCPDSTSTGCFVSWRTYKKGYAGSSYVVSETLKMSVTNPLLWTTAEAYAPSSMNKGGILQNFNKIIDGAVDAQVKGNILWSSKPKFFGNIFLTMKNYHIADINFFYMNIAENVKTRIGMYKKGT